MKVYKCDACGKIIEDPYEVKMKEFYLDAEYDMGDVHPRRAKNKTKIHLCDDCFHGLINLLITK